jgi:hypothetical protein
MQLLITLKAMPGQHANMQGYPFRCTVGAAVELLHVLKLRDMSHMSPRLRHLCSCCGRQPGVQLLQLYNWVLPPAVASPNPAGVLQHPGSSSCGTYYTIQWSLRLWHICSCCTRRPAAADTDAAGRPDKPCHADLCNQQHCNHLLPWYTLLLCHQHHAIT